MNVMTSTTSSASSGSCGCGCGGSCGCSGGGIGAATGQFSRPRFFAGQLLTQEDLEALVDYVVGKNRLHNRYLFGDGVVCGLQLSCEPCDPAGIKVAPGFALDCCGNDILVQCAEKLDVKALLRDLRARQAAGCQCGGPCDDKRGARSYGLYLTYRESPVDPVAPYASGDPCGAQACQPTRIAEGYAFELRCDCAGTARTDVFKRILACVGDIRAAASAVAKAQSNQMIAAQMQNSIGQIKSGQTASYTAQDAQAIKAAPQSFSTLSAMSKTAEKAGSLPPEETFRAEVDQFQASTAALARFRALDPAAQKRTLDGDPALAKAIDAAQAQLGDGVSALRSLAPRAIFDPTMAAMADHSATLAEKYAASGAPASAYSNTEAKMMMLGTPVGNDQAALMKQDALVLKTWLLDRLEGSCSITSCTLYDEVLAIRIGDPKDGVADEAEMEALTEAIRKLAIALVRYFIDCICAALNPPCPDCTDTAVLLGCVEVDECKVLDLCNLSRRFVLTPVAMRYWLPPLGWIGSLFEKLCCEFDPASLFKPKPKEVPAPTEGEGEISVVGYTAKPMMKSTYAPVMRAGSVGDAEVSLLGKLDLTAKDAENVTAFASNMARLAMRSGGDALAALRPGAEAALSRVSSGLGLTSTPVAAPEASVATVADEAKLRDMVSTQLNDALVKERAANEAAAKDAAAKAAAEAAAAREAAAKAASEAAAKAAKEAATATVTASVSKQLTASKLASSVEAVPLVKRLSSENAKLAAELKDLKAAVAKLTKGG